MERVEIELKVNQTPEEIEKILLNHGFTVWHKRRTIANYYSNQNFSPLGLDLKEKSVRVRTSINLLSREKTKNFSVEHFNDAFDQILKTKSNKIKASRFKIKFLIKRLKKNNFKLILTDDKTDFVYMHPEFETNKIAFQIQNIKGLGTIVAYDNENYEKLSKVTQRKKLIEDVKKFGIDIESKVQVDRYAELLNNPNKLSINEIIKIVKSY